MSTLSSANVTDVNLVLKECTHMHLCINMLIFTHNLGNWLICKDSLGRSFHLQLKLIMSHLRRTKMHRVSESVDEWERNKLLVFRLHNRHLTAQTLADFLLTQRYRSHLTQCSCHSWLTIYWLYTLPSTLRVSTSMVGQFQSGLKTILFRLAYGTRLGAFMTV